MRSHISNAFSNLSLTPISILLGIGYAFKEYVHDKGFSSYHLAFEGGSCSPTSPFPRQVSISFNCDHHLNSPKLFTTTSCHYDFEWNTVAACDHKLYNHTEAPCYIFDSDGSKRDLTPLIKENGQYYEIDTEGLMNVKSQEAPHGDKLFINICSDASQKCGPGTASCRLLPADTNQTSGQNETQHLGDVRFSKMSWDDRTKEIVLTYRGGLTTYGCSKLSKPSTTIRFKCPQERKTYWVPSKAPRLINVDYEECDFVIEWETEYACPEKLLKATPQSCIFKQVFNGVDIDLRPLMKKRALQSMGGQLPWIVKNITTPHLGQSSYDAHIAVCGGLGKGYCGGKEFGSVSVCLKPQNGGNQSQDKAIGFISTDSEFTYVNGKAMLVYTSKDEKCPELNNTAKVKTAIEFLCDPQVGNGEPVFNTYQYCTYHFVWRSSLVCGPRPESMSCILNEGGRLYDLNPLTRSWNSRAWRALPMHYNPQHKFGMQSSKALYMNICGPVPRINETSLCDAEAGVCLVDSQTNSTQNLGHFVHRTLQYNHQSDHLQLEYIYEHPDGITKPVKSTISLYCTPGDFTSEPLVVNVSPDASEYSFEWDTGAACPLSVSKGTDCRVYDPDLAALFDLNPLQKEGRPYKIDVGEYEYYINVCGPIKGTPCNNKTDIQDPAACQAKKNDSFHVYTLGRVNTNISYFNGLISLQYEDGHRYRNAEKTPRKAQISFICDRDEMQGSPQFISETNRTYFFEWRTKYACPILDPPVDCVWRNSTHSIDLTGLSTHSANHFSWDVDARSKEHSIFYLNICRPLNKIQGQKCPRGAAACRIDTHKMKDNVIVGVSLGQALDPPVMEHGGSVVLFYKNGDRCEKHPESRMATKIKFICDPTQDHGTPEIAKDEQIEDPCVYLFNWKTDLACPVKISLLLPSSTPAPNSSQIIPPHKAGSKSSSSSVQPSASDPNAKASSSISNDGEQPHSGPHWIGLVILVILVSVIFVILLSTNVRYAFFGSLHTSFELSLTIYLTVSCLLLHQDKSCQQGPALLHASDYNRLPLSSSKRRPNEHEFNRVS